MNLDIQAWVQFVMRLYLVSSMVYGGAHSCGSLMIALQYNHPTCV